MKKEIAIEIIGVSKKFKIYDDRPYSIKDRVLNLRSKNYKEVDVLKNINCKIYKGESVGLIGVNGCGKSTLLKMISKIIYPTTGEIIVNGKIASLLELGAGFHPDFTGRENIYFNGAILGMKRKEIDRKINQIICFSELGEFIDRPIRTYSSGMYMRLAFSVAVHVDSDILLIDEILAVGDNQFQKKCFNKINELRRKGITIILVSHDERSVLSHCDKGIYIKNQSIKKQGEINSIINEYKDDIDAERKY